MEESDGAGRTRVGDECAKVWDEIWQRQPLLFLLIRERKYPFPRSYSHLRLAIQENGEVGWFGSALALGMPTSGDICKLGPSFGARLNKD
jgi:hypothetical protein